MPSTSSAVEAGDSPLGRSLVPLLSVAMAAAAIMYAVLAVLAKPLIDDLGISRAQLGLVISVYSIVAAVLSPIVGGFIDRIGARNGMLMVIAFAAVGFATMSLAVGFWTLTASALIVAIGNAMGNPATNKMIALEVPHQKRGVVTGIKQSGVQVGSFLAGATFPKIVERWQWQGVMLVLGAVFGVMFLWAILTLPRPANANSSSVSNSAARSTTSLPPIIRWMAGYAFLMGAGGSPVFTFLALYAEERLGATPTTAGWIVAVAGLVGITSRISWSIISQRSGDYSRSLLTIALIAVVAAALAVAADSVGLWMLWLAAVVAGASISAWNSVAMLSVINHAGPELAGRASGIVVGGFLAGLALSPPLFGWSIDRFDTYTPGFLGVTLCFVAASGVMVAWLRVR